jgi:pyruvate,water dikinase
METTPRPDQSNSNSIGQVRCHFYGHPAGAGCASGRAFVVTTAEEASAAMPDDVLVLPWLSASIACTLPLVAGVVAELASPLSNGVTVARERGIPVVALAGATWKLRTGDRVTFDGTRGLIDVIRAPQMREDTTACRPG